MRGGRCAASADACRMWSCGRGREGMRKPFSRTRGWSILAGIAALGATLAVVSNSSASDHQDTPEVELSPRMDVNDVYAFPGASAYRIVLAMTTSSPITPAQS